MSVAGAHAEALPIGIIVVDRNGRVREMNERAVAMTGHTVVQAREADARAVLFPGVPTTETTLEPGVSASVRVRREDGTARVWLVESTRAGDDGDVLWVLHDVSAGHAEQERNALDERARALETLAAGVGHELNNPLAFVTSNLSFALGELDRFGTDPATKLTRGDLVDIVDALREALLGTRRVAGIVRDLRHLARAQEVTRQRVDVAHAVQAAIRFGGREIRERGELIADLSPDLFVMCDESRLLLAVTNLLSNASHAVRERSKAQVRVRVTAADDSVHIDVEDNGAGMSAEVAVRVLEPFYSGRPLGSGMGLGLTAAHAFVADLGGRIHLHSEPGIGTRVSMILPRSTTAPADSDAGKKKNQRILVVEDDRLFAMATRRLLARLALDVVIADDGASAWKLLQEDRDFSVILCDVQMPGMSGTTLLQHLCDDAPTLLPRFMFMTGSSLAPEQSALCRAREVRVLEKPFTPKELTQAVLENLVKNGVDVSSLVGSRV